MADRRLIVLQDTAGHRAGQGSGVAHLGELEQALGAVERQPTGVGADRRVDILLWTVDFIIINIEDKTETDEGAREFRTEKCCMALRSRRREKKGVADDGLGSCAGPHRVGSGTGHDELL